MTSCAIIISHYESLPFLQTAIRQMRKYKHPEIEQHIIIADQSCQKTYDQIKEWYSCSADITLVNMKPLWSGYGIDWVIRNIEIETDYICQIHPDILPLSPSWLLLPITLIEENNFSFVGQLHFWSRTTDTIYPPTPFFSMSPTFNVARTETYKEMSLEAGFTRFHNRPQSELTFKNNDWAEWAAADYGARGSDDDTVAFCWESKHRTTDKLGLAISGMIEGHYGRIIDDIVFHFGSCRESIGVAHTMGEGYQNYTKKINENYSDELISEMVELAKANRPNGEGVLTRNLWDGKLKISSPPTEQLNKRIEELKK